MLWEPRNNRSKRGRERNLSRYSSISLGPGTWIQHLSVFVSRSGAVQHSRILLMISHAHFQHISTRESGERYNRPGTSEGSTAGHSVSVAVTPRLIVSMRTQS